MIKFKRLKSFRCDATMKHHLCVKRHDHKGQHHAVQFDGTNLFWTDDGEYEEW